MGSEKGAMFRPHVDDGPFTAFKLPIYRRVKLGHLHLLQADTRCLAARRCGVSPYVNFRMAVQHGEGMSS